MSMIPDEPRSPFRVETEARRRKEDLNRQQKQDQTLSAIADSLRELGELRRLADSAEARAIAAQASAKKATVTSWVSIAIALAAFAWNVVAHFI